ncbi:MAG: single-stranded-DNA-specific exonuclease RecJ [Aquabacterium sp.]|jgi:single-stranded-DNA-specific exonuclease|uniref:single-stranded-DNA-specific exonuclease RecJ n=1 Tax=Aquabacterium sp. TaxID=1872578 RepID=UPI002A358E3F|nr:single-stranded-DNA-specific exonuclease RecJ [Aquabacterium sp.]MDX9844769.1 single-stranded-DNA-specific exonuclease RecJ [Aquabacterium sp.]
MKIIARDVPPRTAWSLEQAGVHPLLARLYAARGVRSAEELDDNASKLLPPTTLRGTQEAAALLADAIAQGQRICIVADYDCDGATACATGLRGLRMLGARADQLSYVVPDRALHGYGLTPPIVDLVKAQQADVLVTVDNGMASHEAVTRARALGMRVIITDHHLPVVLDDGQVSLPDADVIVNPNQPGCDFASKALVGVGVMFYVLLALRAELRQRGVFDATTQPRIDNLLDLVALGTIADVGRLDANNRRLVALGLKRIRAGRMQPGIAALFAAAGRDPAKASSQDFGFALGPRINAAGRLAEMGLGIECLITDDPVRAQALAQQLDGINRERRELEAGMREQAEMMLESVLPEGEPPAALAIFDPEFHEGVVGIVASRLKDRLHRPTFVFALGQDGLLKGSGRSIAGFHLRDALDLIGKRHPGLLRKFGGHAMAAGCTIAEEDFDTFEAALVRVAHDDLDPSLLLRQLCTDGPLDAQWFTAETVLELDSAVWGPGFEAPVFSDEAEVLNQRLVGERHLKLSLRVQGQVRDGIWFGRTEPLPSKAQLAFRIDLNEFQGRQRVQLIVEGASEG